MKKIISVLLAVVMLVSVSAVSVSAFAAGTVQSQQTTKQGVNVNTEVNGTINKNDITFTPDPIDPTQFTFEFTGTGDLEGWEFEGLVEGVDYEVVSQDGDTITIKIIDPGTAEAIASGKQTLTVNAIVDNEAEEEEEEEEKKGGKKNGGSKSPKTGATVATGLAAAGAGAAILLALRKKEDAE